MKHSEKRLPPVDANRRKVVRRACTLPDNPIAVWSIRLPMVPRDEEGMRQDVGGTSSTLLPSQQFYHPRNK